MFPLMKENCADAVWARSKFKIHTDDDERFSSTSSVQLIEPLPNNLDTNL